MRSTTLVLLSFTYLASADEGSAFGDDIPYVAPKRSKLTLRKPAATAPEEESAFGDVDFLKDGYETKKATVSSKPEMPMEEESAFGDVDYLQDVVQDAHIAPSSPPSLRKKIAPAEEESAFGDITLGDVPQGDKAKSPSETGIEQLTEQQSFVEKSELGGPLEDEAQELLDDKEMKDDSEQGLKEKSGLNAEDLAAFGGEEHERHAEEVRASDAKKCTGAQCNAPAEEKWTPVRNVKAYGKSGKPENWKPRRLTLNGKELMADEEPKIRSKRIYSRHQAVEHQAPEKRSMGDFLSSFMER